MWSLKKSLRLSIKGRILNRLLGTKINSTNFLLKNGTWRKRRNFSGCSLKEMKFKIWRILRKLKLTKEISRRSQTSRAQVSSLQKVNRFLLHKKRKFWWATKPRTFPQDSVPIQTRPKSLWILKYFLKTWRAYWKLMNPKTNQLSNLLIWITLSKLT